VKQSKKKGQQSKTMKKEEQQSKAKYV